MVSSFEGNITNNPKPKNRHRSFEMHTQFAGPNFPAAVDIHPHFQSES